MRRWFGLTVLIVACFSSPLWAQNELPPGWQTLPANEFLTAAGAVFDGASPDQRSAMVEHAWDRFLNDEPFVATSDLTTVQAMMIQFAGWSADRLSAGNEQAVIDAELTTLKSRFVARLEGAPDAVNESSFDQLQQLVIALRSADSTNVDSAPYFSQWDGDSAQYFSQWMTANDWASLPIGQQVDLYEGLCKRDHVSFQGLSARWTGSITAPASDSYTFELVRQYAHDPQFKLWINGELVLDSQADKDASAEFFTSTPVQLSVNAPVSFRLEMISAPDDTRYYSRGNPAAALLWKTKSGTGQWVPSSAFSPPEGFADGKSGLKGEYYSDINLEQLGAERLDPALEFVWTWDPIAPFYDAQCQEVFESYASKILAESFLDEQPADESFNTLVNVAVRPTAGRLSLSQRATLARQLSRHGEHLQFLTDHSISKLMQTFYMLPGDEHLDLLVAWAEARPQPRTHPGQLSGEGKDHYSDNWEHYWHIGTFLQGPYWNDVETLWDKHLERPNGECNLAIAYVTCFSAYDHSTAHGTSGDRNFRELLDAKLADESLTGDQRVSWLIARSFAEETMTSHVPRLLQGKEFLEEATLVAQSNDYKFWALGELASRYASLGATDELNQLLENRASSFTAPEQQALLNQCRNRGNEFTDWYEEQEKTENERVNEEYVVELRKRIASAQEQDDTEAVTRYQQLLSDAMSAPKID